MPPNIVYQSKTKTGQDISLRYPVLTDAEQMAKYINTLSLEKTFIRFQGEQQTVEQEQTWIQGILNKINSNTGITLFAE